MSDAPEQPRWYRLSPDRLLPVLLAVEGLFWLSQRFHWFAFNEHKGWTMLIAVATVGVFLLLMFLWFLAALVFRLRFQFSILSLLVLVVVVAVPCAWLATEMKAAREQRQAAEEIRKSGGTVRYDYELDPSGDEIPGAKPPAPAWLHGMLGDDLFVNATYVDFAASKISDAGLEKLNACPQLRELGLADTKVSDAGLEHLEGLTQLHWLSLGHTKVSDAGLEHLKGLTQLQHLYLSGSKVSDAGLEHLKGLTQLQHLYLAYTKVSDAGLAHLKGLAHLQDLLLYGTNVTDAGVKKLQQALPNCTIDR